MEKGTNMNTMEKSHPNVGFLTDMARMRIWKSSLVMANT